MGAALLRAAQVLGLDPADYEACTKSQIKAAWFKLKTTVRGRGGLTYQTAQGRFLEGRIVLFGMSSPHLTEKHIRIGLSRGRRFELLSAAP